MNERMRQLVALLNEYAEAYYNSAAPAPRPRAGAAKNFSCAAAKKGVDRYPLHL